MDDFALNSMATSHRRNVQILQARFRALSRRAERLGLSFSIPKTELIHWRTPKDRSPRCLTPVTLGGHPFHPKEEVRWLGYWFTPNMNTTAHFTRRLALVQGAFTLIKRLSPPGAGLSTLHTRRLVSSLLLPVVAYGADLFVPNGAMTQRLEVF